MRSADTTATATTAEPSTGTTDTTGTAPTARALEAARGMSGHWKGRLRIAPTTSARSVRYDPGVVDTSFLREGLGLPSLADERLGDDGEALRVIYGPTFHANVAITVRRVGELAELEILVEGAAPERELLAAVESARPLALLRQPIDAWDACSRDGLAAHGERWDGRARILAHISNPTPATEAAAYQLLVEVLDFAAARPWSGRTRDALANVRRYLADLDERTSSHRQARRQRQLASRRGRA